jgi:hypothetical protein
LLIRQDLVPMLSSYLVVMTALGLALLRLQKPRAAAGQRARPGQRATPGQPASQPDAGRLTAPAVTGSRGGWPALIRYMVGTAVGGYLLLSAVVVGYYYGVARVGAQFLRSAFTGAALLAGIALPVFAAASWLVERRRRRRQSPGEDAAHGP